MADHELEPDQDMNNDDVNVDNDTFTGSDNVANDTAITTNNVDNSHSPPSQQPDIRVYTCKVCSAKFNSLGEVRHHIYVMHPEIIAKKKLEKEQQKQREEALAEEGRMIRDRLLEQEKQVQDQTQAKESVDDKEEDEGIIRKKRSKPKKQKDEEEDEEDEEESIEAEEERESEDEGESEDESRLSEDEIIARYQEDGILRLKRLKLIQLLKSLPITERVRKYVLSFYDTGINYQKDNNELAMLLRSAGIAEHMVQQVMRILVSWETNAFQRLFQIRQGIGASGTAAMPYGYGYSSPWSFLPPPPAVQAPFMYDPHRQNPYDRPPYPSPLSPYHHPSYYPPPMPYPPITPTPPSQQLTPHEIRQIIKEEMREKERKTEIDKLREEMTKKFEMIMGEVKSLAEQNRNKQSEEPYVEYEEIVLDPVTRKPLIDDNTRQPIKILKRVPISMMPTHSSSKYDEVMSIFDRLLEKYNLLQQHGSRGNEEVMRLTNEINELKNQLEKYKDELSRQERQRLEDKIQQLEALIHAQNASGWQNDAARLLSTSISEATKLLKEKQPLRDIAALALGIPQITSSSSQTKPPKTGDTSMLEDAAAKEGLLDAR